MGQQTRGSRTAGKADTSDGAERTSDRRARRAKATERDKPLEDAYNAGRRGDDPAEWQTSDELYGYYQDGAKAARAETRGARVSQLRGDAVGKAGGAAADGAGFVLGLIAYALLANFLRGGKPAVRDWFAAKFLNETRSSDGRRAEKPAAPTKPESPGRYAIPATPYRGGGM